MREVRIARSIDDLIMVYAIRVATYMDDQACPYDEEFDGNDLCATHLLGLEDGNPAGCLRVRWFAGFAKVERLAVRHGFRKTQMSFELVRSAVELIRRKGYTKIYGHSQEGMDHFWARFGAMPLPGRDIFKFSGRSYTEIEANFEPHSDPISYTDPGTDPMVILRPEGNWDRPGVLERR